MLPITKTAGLMYTGARYRSKGRPSNKTVEKFSIPGALEEHVKELRREMNYKDGTEIVLILSFASDEMIRMVHMFPEVFFMDVTNSTNRQNKPLFLMVVKDANGETHVGNISVLPSEKKWVFNEIYQTIFVSLYGETTMNRNRLMLTDEDTALYEREEYWYIMKHLSRVCEKYQHVGKIRYAETEY